MQFFLSGSNSKIHSSLDRDITFQIRLGTHPSVFLWPKGRTQYFDINPWFGSRLKSYFLGNLWVVNITMLGRSLHNTTISCKKKSHVTNFTAKCFVLSLTRIEPFVESMETLGF